jgi:hypothetical protein
VTKVLFIGGAGRSGSTLLDRVIGQLPGYVSVGELRSIWIAALRENRLCGCGEPFMSCPFWRQVGDDAFGGWGAVDPDEMETAVASLSYLRVWRGLVGRSDPPVSPRVADRFERLYAAISSTAGGATIVDSSKGPRYGYVLSSLPEISLRVIHLVRDSRGVVYSWSKEITRPDTPGRSVQMLRMGTVEAAARWVVQNTFTELLGQRAPVTRLRYETLLEDPHRRLQEALADLGEELPEDGLGFLESDAVQLRPNHTVMGNPMRMASGSVVLRTDDAWRRQLKPSQRRIVTALTAPWLWRYGYPLRSAD